MRCFSPIVVAIVVAACCSAPGSAFAQMEASPAEVAAARRALAAAKIEARHVRQVEYQCELRELNAAIEVADEEVRTMRRQLRSYGSFHPFAYGQQPAFAYRNARICLAEAEARYRLLVDKRANLGRAYADKLALSQLDVAAARERLVELEGGGVIELEVSHP